MIADPFRVADCCLISDGAGAFVMTSTEQARDYPKPPVVVAGVGRGMIEGAPYISQQKQLTATPQTFSAPWAYAMADITPKDLDVIGVYDCFSGTALMQIEDMGLCRDHLGQPRSRRHDVDDEGKQRRIVAEQRQNAASQRNNRFWRGQADVQSQNLAQTSRIQIGPIGVRH